MTKMQWKKQNYNKVTNFFSIYWSHVDSIKQIKKISVTPILKFALCDCIISIPSNGIYKHTGVNVIIMLLTQAKILI